METFYRKQTKIHQNNIGTDGFFYFYKFEIKRLCFSVPSMYDEGGRLHYCVDETLRRRLETKLITKILAFEAV